jgi:hypothetical protein
METNHEDLKDLKEIFAGCMEGQRFCLFEVFVVHFFFSAPSRLAILTV